MRIIFMGNPAIAVPSLTKFNASNHLVEVVVSNPPKPMGRGRKLNQTPVANQALELNLPLFLPQKLTEPDFIESLKVIQPELFVVVAFKILPEVLLDIPSRGAVNLHTSLLPAYRGAAPIQRALMNGDSETGLTTFLIEPKVDRGAILLQQRMSIHPEDDYGSLAEKMAIEGANLLLKTVYQLEDGSLKPQPQNPAAVSWAPKIKPEECRINWDQPAEKIHNLIRALSPTPGAFTFLNQRRIKFLKSSVISTETNPSPGVVVSRTPREMTIGTGNGLLQPLVVQPEGKRKMSVQEFLRGASIQTGDRFH
jgi:methionyl-tRNA formyltransferase